MISMLYYQVLADLLNNTLFKILWKNEAYIVHNKSCNDVLGK